MGGQWLKIATLLSALASGTVVMAQEVRHFEGVLITDAEMAAQPPRNVYSRQLAVDRLSPVNELVRNCHILFRKSFELDRVREAKVYITADDYYKLYVNGSFVGQGPASGEVAHTYYNTLDVTKYLREGRNVLSVHTYYQGLVNRVWVSGDNRHGLILDLVADGKTVVKSDATFRTQRHRAYAAMGVAGYLTQILERYDAGAPEVGFECPDFDDSKWANATVHPHGGDYAFFPQPTPMLMHEEIRPVKIERTAAGTVRADFGGIYVGSLRFAAKGPKGAMAEIRCGQELEADGAVRYHLRANCDYVESFVLSGGERDVLNQFDYKSFRYVEILPTGGVEIDLKSLVLVARHLPFALKAKPNFTDPGIAPIWKLCVDSFRYGVQEQIQDCMEREKGYYLGDGCYTMLTYCKLTGDWTSARRFIDDFLRTAKIDRGLVTCGGCSWMQEIAEYPCMFIWFVKEYLRLTGEAAFVSRRFDRLADILNTYRERYAREDGLIANLDKWCVVEWPENFQDGYDAEVPEGKICRDVHVAINAWYLGAIGAMNEIAAAVGRGRYADLTRLTASFQKAFYEPSRHLFVDREGSRHVSLPGNTYATFFGLEPAAERDAHHAAFVAMVREKRFSSISLFQFFPLFAWLDASGERALRDELLLSPDAWLRNLREGATRTFEGWGRDTKWNTSLFHLTIASVAYFLCE